jgi:hypothetical protein
LPPRRQERQEFKTKRLIQHFLVFLILGALGVLAASNVGVPAQKLNQNPLLIVKAEELELRERPTRQ